MNILVIIIAFILVALLFGGSYAFCKSYEKKNPVPQSYRMNQDFHNELHGKPWIKDTNGNIFVMVGESRYYL